MGDNDLSMYIDPTVHEVVSTQINVLLQVFLLGVIMFTQEVEDE